jgi:hypothetical protein
MGFHESLNDNGQDQIEKEELSNDNNHNAIYGPK